MVGRPTHIAYPPTDDIARYERVIHSRANTDEDEFARNLENSIKAVEEELKPKLKLK